MGNLSSGQELAAMHHLELAFLQDVAPKYLSHATPPHGLRIREWKNRSAVPLINRLHSGLSGLKRQSAQVLDHELVWLEGGNPQGTPVVLLHGFASNKENWLSLAPFLLKKHRLFILDLPGWGESQFNANVPYGLDDQVERVAAWMVNHVPAKAHLVGNSVGGLVSALLAGRHPDLLQSLCLMNPAGGKGEGHTLFEAGLREGRNPMIVENYAGAHTFMNLVVHSKAIALALAPVMAQEWISRQHVNRHLFHQMFVNAPNPNGPGMSATRAPTLIMWGKEDKLVHYTGAYTYQTIIAHADVVIFDSVGHLPMLEIPIRTAKALQGFWSC